MKDEHLACEISKIIRESKGIIPHKANLLK